MRDSIQRTPRNQTSQASMENMPSMNDVSIRPTCMGQIKGRVLERIESGHRSRMIGEASCTCVSYCGNILNGTVTVLRGLQIAF